MRPVLLVPGICNSGPTHWQSLWEARYPKVLRLQQRDWDHPVCDTWAEVLGQAIRQCAEPPIVVAHSLGCLVVARWAAHTAGDAAQAMHAALLVAVPDPGAASFPAQATGFLPFATSLGGRRVTLVSSSDDPFSSPAYTAQRVADWGAEHFCLGALGHLNASSGLVDWPEGWAIVQRWRNESR